MRTLALMYCNKALEAEDLVGHIIATLEILGAIVPTLEENPVALAGVMTVIMKLSEKMVSRYGAPKPETKPSDVWTQAIDNLDMSQLEEE